MGEELTHTAQQTSARDILRAVLESPREIVIFALDTSYRYLAFNEAHRRVIAQIWRVDITVGQCMLDIIGREDDRVKAKENFDRALAGEHFAIVEEYGEEGPNRRYFEDVYSPIVAADGRVIGLTLFLTDITDQRQAQLELESYRARLESLVDERTVALRASEALYRTLVVHAPVAVMVHRAGKILFANPAAATLCDATDAALIEGRELEEIFTETENKTAASRGKTVGLAARSGARNELSLTRPDGAPVFVEWTAMPVEFEGGPATLVLAADISARKYDEVERLKFEEQLRHTQKLESLGLLAGGITHDFNNLLVGILGNADLALRRPEAQANAELRLLLERIKTASVRASELTTQLLAYSGSKAFQVHPLDLSSLVREMSELMNVSVASSGQLVLDLMESPPAIDGNSAQIRQVVMNLITNAADAVADTEGTVTLRTKVVTLSRAMLSATYVDDSLPAGQYLCIEVSDTGSGMDEATRTRLFDPFFTTKAKGRGLGLAAVLGIVRSHAGAISVKSTPGEGSTFCVFFPKSEHAVVTETPTLIEGWRGSGTVLVADDEPGVRQVLTMMLTEIGFRVLEASTAAACVELYREHAASINAIMLDLVMPGGGGREVVRALRAEGHQVPVVLSSGYSEEAIGPELRADPHLTFLEKPYDYDAFVRTLKTAIAGGARPSA
ncbi:MAG: sensory box histidine kinase/response regulator [Myxococcaceae bacterium]|nr:sensory box histidine kinase/response regulator [Myxococcaceae bacterium]